MNCPANVVLAIVATGVVVLATIVDVVVVVERTTTRAPFDNWSKDELEEPSLLSSACGEWWSTTSASLWMTCSLFLSRVARFGRY